MLRSRQQTVWKRSTMVPPPALSVGNRILWTLGNLLMVAGLYLLLYVGGLYAEAEHNRLAARGDSDLPPPAAVSLPPREVPAAFTAPVPVPFTAPVLNREGQASSSVPAMVPHTSTVSRVAIPSIGVDSKVVEVAWDVVEQQGQQMAVWQVAEYAVGQHKTSANPGEGGNVVLAGHVGGYGKVFLNLFYIKLGDQITLYSEGQQYLYVVQERLVLKEEGVAPEQRTANARYIEPTDQEMITLITCWPLSGKQKYSERIVVQAVPYGANLSELANDGQQSGPGTWTIR